MTINPGSFQPPIFGASNLVATGTTQAGAMQLVAGGNVFSVVPPGSGGMLPAPNQNQVLVFNNGANALKIYPNFGDRIGLLAVGLYVTIEPGGSGTFYSFDTPLMTSPRTWLLGATNTAAGVNVVADDTTTITAVTRLQFAGGTVTDAGDGVADIDITPSTSTIVAQGGPFLASGTVTNGGTIHNSTTSLTAQALLLGDGTSPVFSLGARGSTVTVLHGNASGNPSWGAVDLGADVTGTLPFAHLNAMAAGLLGNSGTVSATPDVIHIGANLTLASGTLSVATGAGGVTLAGQSILGNDGTVSATGTSVAIGANLTLNAGTLSASGGGGGSGIGTLIAGGITSTASITAMGGGVIISRPALASFTWANQGSATGVDNTHGPITVSLPASTNNYISLLYETPGAGSFSRTVQANYQGSTTGFTMPLCVSDGTKYQYALLQNQILKIEHATTFNGTRTADITPIFTSLSNPIWLRVTWDPGTTTITYSWSIDGFQWFTLFTTASPFVTPSQVGFGTYGATGNTTAAAPNTIAINVWSNP